MTRQVPLCQLGREVWQLHPPHSWRTAGMLILESVAWKDRRKFWTKALKKCLITWAHMRAVLMHSSSYRQRLRSSKWLRLPLENAKDRLSRDVTSQYEETRSQSVFSKPLTINRLLSVSHHVLSLSEWLSWYKKNCQSYWIHFWKLNDRSIDLSIMNKKLNTNQLNS